MDLRKAYEIVIKDILGNHHGNIDEECLENANLEELAKEFADCDEFMDRLVDAAEDVVADYIDDFGDEYGLL